jgi:hypothetical protein
MLSLRLVLFYSFFSWSAMWSAGVFAEVAVAPVVQTVYDQSPRLRISGNGFAADEHSILLDLAALGQPMLRADMDFGISKSDDGLTLKLLADKR